jgi:hypothetical protein
MVFLAPIPSTLLHKNHTLEGFSSQPLTGRLFSLSGALIMSLFALDLFSPAAWEEFWARWIAGILIFLCTTVLSYFVGQLAGRYRASREWNDKRFLGRINIGVNCFMDGTLKIRLLTERSLEQVFLNPIAVEKIRQAAKQTTLEKPLLELKKEDCWYLLNFVLGAFTEQFSQGIIRFDAGHPVQPLVYRLFLTSEKAGEDRVHKVRALLIQEAHLRNFPYMDSMPKLEDPNHIDRVETLRVAARMFDTHPHYFMRVELYV